MKIRKSCGLACEGLTPTVNVTLNCTAGTLTATAGFDNYIWSDANGTLAETSNVLTPGSGGTYTVVAYDNDGCPGTAEGTLPTTCCDAVAGTISGFSQNETLCQAASNTTTFSTDADPQPSGYSYALFLVDGSGNIIIASVTGGTSTSFDFTGLSTGMYFIYGLSYLDSQAATNAADYVDGFATLALLQADIIPNGGSTCAELAMHAFKLTIVDPSCGTFPQN